MDFHGLTGPAEAIVGLTAVTLLSLPACKRIWTASRTKRHHDGYGLIPSSTLFETADGKATEESITTFTDRKPRIAAWISLTIGAGASIAAAVLGNINGRHNLPHSAYLLDTTFFDVAAWCLLLAQCASIPTKAQYDTRFRLAVFGLFSAAALLVSLVLRFSFAAISSVGDRNSSPLVIGLGASWLLEAFAALTVALAFASWPHRPDVYDEKGRIVDQQHASSLLTRFSFSWNRLIFDISKERQLNLEDIPSMDGDRRSGSVTANFLSRNLTGRLHWKLLVHFKYAIAVQWAFTLVQAVLALFPQLALYNFLAKLENRDRADNMGLWGWVAGLAAASLLQIFVSSTSRWLTTSWMETPILSLLQSLVFQKALRLDEAAEPGQRTTDKAGDEAESPKDKEKKPGGGDTRQSVINHMKLDSGRMIIFCGYGPYFPLAIFKLFLAGTFLERLLGWKALLSGMLCAIAVIPLSHNMSKRYGKIQFGLMKYRDGKAHVLTEALQGMRQIKYSALEQLYEKKIIKSRNEELAQYWRVAKWMCGIVMVINLGPILLSCVALTVYVYTTADQIKASVIFASLGLFDQMDEAIGYLPLLQVYLMEAWTSCLRLEKYLNQPEKVPVSTPGDSIAFHQATFRWPKVEDAEFTDAPTPPEEENRSILRDVTLDFPNRELSVITGKTGAGKSLLLAGILGEVKLLSGSITMPELPSLELIETEEIADDDWMLPNLTSFVSQTPWIESGTVRENITFGMPFNQLRYNKVLHACALEKDVELLVEGDKTEVGPKGVTLSGGQRWRVALARALYSRAGILVLDDVLSAVDAHVGRTIVDEALTGELAHGRTRILATHHADLVLPRASYLVKLDDGRLGSTEHLVPEETTPPASDSGTIVASSATSVNGDANENGEVNGRKSNGTVANNQDDKKSTKTDDEKRESGRVKFDVYKAYLRSSNSITPWLFSLVLLFLGRANNFALTWSLKELSEVYSANSVMAKFFNQSPDTHPNLGHDSLLRAESMGPGKSATFWMMAYNVCSVLVLVFSALHSLTFTIIGLRASKRLFERMTHAILRAPLRWTDTTPSGRILNRFTSDTFVVDRRLAAELGSLMHSTLNLIMIIFTSLTISPYVIICGFILFLLYGGIANSYISAAREVKRINSVSHSPIYDQFSSVLSGLSTIRAFNRSDYYRKRMYTLIDNGAKSTWSLSLLGRWMAFRLSMLGVVFVTVVAIAVTLSGVDAGLAGFGLVFALRYTGALTGLLMNITSIELGFNAAERILEYAEIKTEPEDGDDPPAAWPSQGRIEVEDLTVGYSEELPAVLKGLNFEAKAGERIGVVGRTGAGKSTMAAVFFRLLEARSGSIRIDNIDISKLKLSHLRSRLAIIPQDPFLFSGTLRSNLDMEGNIDDYELLQVLQRVHLIDPHTGDPERPSAYPPVDDIAEAAVQPEAVPTESGNIASTTGPAAGGSVLDVPAVIDGGDDEDATKNKSGTITPGSKNTSNAFTDLSTPISTGGANLSQGQRQLVCLARALLTRPKVVVLDEATSAVDRGTDGAIQQSLRKEFASGGCTVLVIAHRLSTVVDFDRLLVLREGKVAEMGTPEELLRRGMEIEEERERVKRQKEEGGEEAEGGEEEPSQDDGAGAFWDLVKRSAEKDKLVEMVLGVKSGEAAVVA